MDDKAEVAASHPASKAVTRREKWWRPFLDERQRALAAQRARIPREMQAEPYRQKPVSDRPAPPKTMPRPLCSEVF